MSRAFELVKECVDIVDVAQKLGIEVNRFGKQVPAYPVQQSPAQGFTGAPNSFANGVAAADSILPPQMYSDEANGRVA